MGNTLSDLNISECCVIDRLLVQDDIRRRLQDIGAINGTEVKCVLKSPSGDPCAYEIRGAVVAIRNSDAKMIKVTKKPVF